MKKQILNIGNLLSKTEQKNVLGGNKGFGDLCTNPTGANCDPYAGQMHGNPACRFDEICVLTGHLPLLGTCVCPEN